MPNYEMRYKCLKCSGYITEHTANFGRVCPLCGALTRSLHGIDSYREAGKWVYTEKSLRWWMIWAVVFTSPVRKWEPKDAESKT